MDSLLERLHYAGFFNFEDLDNATSSFVFESLRNLNLKEITDVLLLIDVKIEIEEKKFFKSFKDRKDISSYKILRKRILLVLSSASFWIEKQKVLKFIPHKRNRG